LDEKFFHRVNYHDCDHFDGPSILQRFGGFWTVPVGTAGVDLVSVVIVLNGLKSIQENPYAVFMVARLLVD